MYCPAGPGMVMSSATRDPPASPDPALPGVRVEVVVRTVGKTGVEMEALTGASVALLTVYDMAKALDKSMVLSDISLAAKVGGVRGDYARLDGTTDAP